MQETNGAEGSSNERGRRAEAVRRNRLIGLAALAAAALAFFLWAFWPRALAVDMGVVERGDLSVELSEEGRTRIREVFQVSAPIPGRLERVSAEPGDIARAGETILARIRPIEPAFLDRRTRLEMESAVSAAAAARDGAAAEARRAESRYRESEQAFQRARSLVEAGVAAQARLDAARAERDAARAAWDAARDQLRAREADLARVRAALIGPGEGDSERADACCLDVPAPADGEVLRVFQESETVLAQGVPIMEIGDPDDLEVVSEMLSSDAVRIEPGDAVRIDGWGGAPLSGRVRLVEPAAFTKVSALGVEEQRVNVIVDFEGPAEMRRGLAHGFRVDVHVEVERKDDAVLAPAASLFRLNGDHHLFALEGGRAQLRAVTLGERTAQQAEILSGVEPGERVVLYPGKDVSEGRRVTSRAESSTQN